MSEPQITFDSSKYEFPAPSISHHTFHHYEPVKPTISVDVEKNSRGVTWSAKVGNASSVEEAMTLLDKVRDEMSHRYGSVQVVT